MIQGCGYNDLPDNVLGLKIGESAARYYRAAGRRYPWRRDRSWYRMIITEVLLRKTRADAVVTVREELLLKFPNFSALRNGQNQELQDILRPLGLHRLRSIQLLNLAHEMRGKPLSVFRNHEVSARLPAIGAYSARAIACFGFGTRIGLVDCNTTRILHRVFRADGATQSNLQRLADRLVSHRSPRASNYGLLDIGALLCRPKPDCNKCPLLRYCEHGQRVC